MGWNQGYTIFEETVVKSYDLGKLDKDLLSVLLEPYRNTDIDSGGSYDLRSKDGKSVEEIVIETWGLTVPSRPDSRDDDAMDKYHTEMYDQFHAVTKHFGW